MINISITGPFDERKLITKPAIKSSMLSPCLIRSLPGASDL